MDLKWAYCAHQMTFFRTSMEPAMDVNCISVKNGLNHNLFLKMLPNELFMSYDILWISFGGLVLVFEK